MIKSLMKSMRGQNDTRKYLEWNRRLIQREAVIGGQLFGPVENGRRREFFCLDEHTWIWHEEWTGADGKQRSTTTRYDVRPDGIVKSQNGQYLSVTLQEAERLEQAVTLYQQRVNREVYGLTA